LAVICSLFPSGGYSLSSKYFHIILFVLFLTFFISLPCCVIAMVIIFFLLRNKVKAGQPLQRLPTDSTEPQTETAVDKFLRMDWIGALIFIAGGILLLLALNWGSTGSWNATKVIVSFVIGGLLIIAFIFWEYVLERQLTAPVPPSVRVLATEPLVPLEVFRSYDVCAVQYASFVSGMVMLVMFYFVAIFMTIVLQLSPGQAGVQLVYFAPGMVCI
jgi:Fungal trichothecene efflux pump (TRI12)